jgi:hypothetical protein|uniref:Outer membrane protein beta-barrel domain-containing protein n=1 Tax=Desulfobacca acetoxidans TaxID=60893 RepID=A0A7V6A529_9BACT
MKKITVFVMALGLIALTAGTAPAEMYVEMYFGNNFAVTSPNPLELNFNPNYKGPFNTSLEFPRTLISSFLFGGKAGIWFSKQGFPQLDFPDWMKYLGFYLDLSYNGFDKSALVDKTIGTRRMNIFPSPYPHYQQYQFSVNRGSSITSLAFMFACRYGFFPTEKVPFGKVQPYVAVGPALFITGISPNFRFQPSAFEVIPIYGSEDRTVPLSYTTVVTPGLETELGVRFLFTRKNGPPGRAISFETSVKYRYYQPSLSYDLDAEGFTHRLKFSPQFNLFSIQAGVGYHF